MTPPFGAFVLPGLAALIQPAIASAATLNQLASVQFVSNVPFDHQLRTAKILGVHRVRLAAIWNAVERPRGRYTWRNTDARIAAVLKAGFVPIITLYGANDSYPSADGEPNAPPIDGEALAGFAKFAAATVARYGIGQANMPILYEIWNEPNTKTFWKRVPDPIGYARMAEAACHAIRARTPNARVLALGMEGWPVKRPYRVAAYDLDIYQQWAARAATPRLMACADGISFHPYLPQPEQVLEGEPLLRAYLGKIWERPVAPLLANTEWGYSLSMKAGGSGEKQAAIDLRALLIGTGLGRVTNLYQAIDAGRDPTKSDQTYGLVTIDGAIKPAGFAVQRLLVAIGNYEIDGVEPIAATPGLYRFNARRGKARAQVFWSTAAVLTTIKVPADATLVDLVTGAQGVGDANGRALVGPNPLLVRWGLEEDRPDSIAPSRHE